MLTYVPLAILFLCLFALLYYRHKPGVYFMPFSAVVLVTIYATGHAWLFFGESKKVMAVLLVNFSPLFLLVGPLVYLYTKSILLDRFDYSARSLLHFLPFFVFVILTLPYILTPYAYKLAATENLINDISVAKSFRLTEAIPWSVNILMRPLHLITYCLASLVLLKNFISDSPAPQKSEYLIHVLKVKRSIRRLIFIFLFSVGLYYIMTLLWMNYGFVTIRALPFQVLYWVTMGGLISIPVYLLRNPDILLGIPSLSVNQEQKSSRFTVFDEANQNALTALMDRVLSYVNSLDKPTDNLLSSAFVQRVSQALNAKQHHVEYCLTRIRQGQLLNTL